ncbi:hypothetical protein EDD17DRAFT_1662423 [Pisolithus thermaeus]|nr:hypothetical protein EDD17DRAFT_1662423 [Pisolithus thermaeus]
MLRLLASNDILLGSLVCASLRYRDLSQTTPPLFTSDSTSVLVQRGFTLIDLPWCLTHSYLCFYVRHALAFFCRRYKKFKCLYMCRKQA